MKQNVLRRPRIIFASVAIAFLVNLTIVSPSPRASGRHEVDYRKLVIHSHPRIFINKVNIAPLRVKLRTSLAPAYALLTTRMAHSHLPRRLDELRDYIYKYGFLYQMTHEDKWGDYALNAMRQIPASLRAYGGRNNGYAYAIEGLSIGFDWCYDKIVKREEQDYFISLINKYFPGNLQNIKHLPDFHNYAAQAELAMLLAGLSTYGDNPKGRLFISQAREIVEFGCSLFGRWYNVKESVSYVDGTCNWEGLTYGRRQLFAYIKYCEALRTATEGKINPWDEFACIENAGYYVIYSLRPDGLFENIGDVNYRKLTYFDINNIAALQSTFKNRHFSAFLKRYYHLSEGKFRTNVWLGHYNASLIFFLIWYDPNVPAAPLEHLPKSKRFGDVVVIRTGFKPEDTFVTFKCGLHWGFHTQLDHGSFTIFKYAPLAIDSGFYDTWWGEGRRQNWNYWKRTIAHNTLLIYNPEEKEVHWPRNFQLVNDGGQRPAWVTFHPPHMWTGGHNRPMCIRDLERRFEEFEMGRIETYEYATQYVYIKADLTKAYNNKYCGRGSNPPCKVAKVVREFVFIPDRTIITFDKIISLKRVYNKKWLLHCGSYYDKSGKPELNGKFKLIRGNEEGGIAESTDTDLVRVTNGAGKLFFKILLPQDCVVRRIGGKGYEFWVNGENWPISKRGIPKGREDEDPGAWRVEVEPAKRRKYDEFLIVLYACGKRVQLMPTMSYLEAQGGNFAGADLLGWKSRSIILFNRRSRTV
ncbi:hypothetical protein DRN98_03630, partial [Methanosarcinales archaeon]